jgi:hypothetical protein
MKISFFVLLLVLSSTLLANGKEYCTGKNYFAFSIGGKLKVITIAKGKEIVSGVRLTPKSVYRPFMLKCNKRNVLAWTGQYKTLKGGAKEFRYTQYNINIVKPKQIVVKGKSTLSEAAFSKLGVPGGFAYFLDYCKDLLGEYSKVKSETKSHEHKVKTSNSKFIYVVRIDSKIIRKEDSRLKSKKVFWVKVFTENLPKGYDKCTQKAFIVKKDAKSSKVLAEKLVGEGYSTLIKNSPYMSWVSGSK